MVVKQNPGAALLIVGTSQPIPTAPAVAPRGKGSKGTP